MSVLVIPNDYEMDSAETLPLAFDTAPYLSGVETPTNPRAELIDAGSGATYTAGLSGSPSVAGTIITQTVTALERGKKYELKIIFQAAVGKVMAGVLRIECTT